MERTSVGCRVVGFSSPNEGWKIHMWRVEDKNKVVEVVEDYKR